VYELYGLSDEEIRIVEQGTGTTQIMGSGGAE